MIKINSYNDNFSPSFSAEFVKKVPVLKYNQANKTYTKIEANFMKLNPNCAEDVRMAEKVCFNDRFREFGEYLFNEWTGKLNSPSVKSNNFYSLVLPKEEQNNLSEINSILGITEFIENRDNKKNKIMFMITNKDYQWNDTNNARKFAHIGEGMTNALKELFPQKPMSVFADWNAINFWTKQGFENNTMQRTLIYNG